MSKETQKSDYARGFRDACDAIISDINNCPVNSLALAILKPSAAVSYIQSFYKILVEDIRNDNN